MVAISAKELTCDSGQFCCIMKKSISTLLLLGLTTLSFAQISLKPYVGISTTTFALSTDKKYDDPYESGETSEINESHLFRTGLNLGLGVNIPINDNFSFEPGLRFVQKGSVIKEDYNESTFGISLKANTNLRYDYLEIPLNMQYQVEMGDWYLSFYAGPTVSFLADFRMRSESEIQIFGMQEKQSSDTKTDINLKKDIRESLMLFDLGLNAGVQLRYRDFTVSLGYQRGFLESMKARSFRNQGFLASVGYTFEL